MTRILFAISFLFFSIVSFAQRDSIIGGVKCHLVSTSSDTGTVWIQQKVKKKSGEYLNGYYFEFYPGGKLKRKGWYKMGKRTAIWRGYYADGKIAFEGYYNHGYKSDLWKIYYPNGKLSFKGNFFKDLHSGFCYYYYENGNLKAKTRYVITVIRTKGEVRQKRPGSLVKTKVEIHYSVVPVDSLVEYYPDGKLKCRIMYDEIGRLNGTSDYYYEDGKINLHANYFNNVKTGEWKFYCKNGNLMKNISYDNKGNETTVSVQETLDECGYFEILPELQWRRENFPPIK